MKNKTQENGIIQFYLKGTKIFKKTTEKQRQRERNGIRGEREGEGGREIFCIRMKYLWKDTQFHLTERMETG